MIKRTFQHLEAQHITAFFAFVALGFALDKDHGHWVAVVFSFIGLVLAWSAARNSYLSKSTALIDKYDERFNEKMVRERRSAALYLLGENPNADELEDILDFFETPIAAKLNSGCIDVEQVYDTFYHWIRLYWQASQKFLGEYHAKEPAAYTELEDYVKLHIISGIEEFPSNYKGVSGGGIWYQRFVTNDEKTYRVEPILTGIVCWQSQPTNKKGYSGRDISGHCYVSIYRQVKLALMRAQLHARRGIPPS